MGRIGLLGYIGYNGIINMADIVSQASNWAFVGQRNAIWLAFLTINNC